MRLPWILSLLLALAMAATALPAAGESLELSVTPVALNPDQPQQTRLGALQWRGGVALASQHKSFGGYSGMVIAPDMAGLRAISDTGTWLTLGLRYDSAGILVGAERAMLGPLLDLGGKALKFSDEADAESLAMLADGSLLVGFERRHRLWRYPAGAEQDGLGLAGRPVAVPAPPDLHLAPFNEGLEALTALPDGRVLALAEDFRRHPGTTAGWIATIDGTNWQWLNFDYRLSGAYRVTDAAALPNGDVLVLERSFSVFDGFKARLMRIDGVLLKAGAPVEAREVARFEPPYITDNFEALAARVGPDGKILIWLLSDDNFSRRQRSLLLHFALEP